jgi:hypothetical protein
MRPIAAEHDSGGGGSAMGSRVLGVVERGHRPDTKVGLDGERAQRQHQGRFATKHDGGGGGGMEAEEEVAWQRHRHIFLFCHTKRRNG